MLRNSSRAGTNFLLFAEFKAKFIVLTEKRRLLQASLARLRISAATVGDAGYHGQIGGDDDSSAQHTSEQPSEASEMSAAVCKLLLDVVDQGFDRQSWHGPNLRGSIRGVTHRQAIWRPQPQRHNIWEHVLHTAYWKYTIRRRILGEKRGSFPIKGSNWFQCESPSAKAWRDDVQLLVETHQSMRAAIAELTPNQLSKRLKGAKVTYFHLISGIAAHDVYHAGQIQLLKRMQV